MDDVQDAIVTVIPRYVTEPLEIVHHFVEIIPLALTASFVNLNSLVTQPFKAAQVSVEY